MNDLGLGSWWFRMCIALGPWWSSLVKPQKPTHSRALSAVRMNAPWRLPWSGSLGSAHPWALIGYKLRILLRGTRWADPPTDWQPMRWGAKQQEKATWIPCCSNRKFGVLFSGGRISCHWDGATLGIATNHRSLLSWVWSIPAERCWVSSGFHSPQHGPTSTENWRFLLKMAPIYPGSR